VRGARGGGGVAALQPLVQRVAVVRLQQQRARAVHGARGDLGEHWTFRGMASGASGPGVGSCKERALLADRVAVSREA